MSPTSLPGNPGKAAPEEASARDLEYVLHTHTLHSHKHVHGDHAFHYHRHEHAGGEQEHLHEINDPLHEEHPHHQQYHLVG